MAIKPADNALPKGITSEDVSTWFSDNWPWAAPAIYIYVTIVGMVQAWFQFKAFDINIFEFSETNDFLLAAFRDPRSFLAIIGIIAYGGLYVSFSKFVNKDRFSFLSSRLVRVITFLVIAIAAPFIVLWVSHGHIHFKKAIKDALIADPVRNMDVLFRSGSENANANGFEQGWIKGLIFIGTTDKYAFFYSPKDSSKDEKSNAKGGKPAEATIITPLANVIVFKCTSNKGDQEEKPGTSSNSSAKK